MPTAHRRQPNRDDLHVATLDKDQALALFDTFFATAPVGLAFLDTAFRYVRVNAALAEMDGLPIEAHLGRTPAEVLPGIWPALQQVLPRVLEAGEPLVDIEVAGETPRHPGEPRSWLVSYYPVRLHGGDIIGLGGVILEITERKRAQVALQASEARARFLANAGALLISSLDYEATVANAARAAIPTLADWCAVDVRAEDGRPERAATARVDRPEAPASPVPGQAPGAGVLEVLRTGQPELVSEVAEEPSVSDAGIQDEARRLGLCSWMAVPLRAHGEVIGAMSFGRLALSRRYGPADLALAEDLARQAGASIDDAWHHRELQHAVRLRDDVLATVAHDLKAPLTSIKGNADLLMRQAQAERPDPERVRARAEAISAVAARMAEQIGELVDAARLQAGQRLDLMRRPTDLVALVARAAGQVQATTGKHTIRAESTVPELVGEWDSLRLERVVGNLLANAVQYSPGGGTVTARVAYEDDAGRAFAVVQVQDEGIGIPAADLPRIFERYHRGRNVTGRIAGTGIGLAGAKQIVEQHGGRIDVDSVEGQGATFTVWLPLGQAGPQLSARQLRSTGRRGHARPRAIQRSV